MITSQNQPERCLIRARLEECRAEYLAAKTDAEVAVVVATVREVMARRAEMPRGIPSRVLTGETFGRLSVICEAGSTHRGAALWCCRCRCGTRKVVGARELMQGSTESCGCLRRELTLARTKGVGVKRKLPIRSQPLPDRLPGPPEPPPRPAPAPTDREAMLLGLGRSMRLGRARWAEVAEACGDDVAAQLRAEHEQAAERGVV